MIGLFAFIVVIAGCLLMLAGVFGIWLAMSSPIQLQPIPAIAFMVGLCISVFGVALWNSGVAS